MKPISKKDLEDIKKQMDTWSLSPTNYYFNSFERQQVENGKIYTIRFSIMDETWYLNGKCHRESGPAYINTMSQISRWFLEGEEVSEEDFPKKLKLSAFW